jgi:ribosomal protein S18 acetylase RimI-like enzyme
VTAIECRVVTAADDDTVDALLRLLPQVSRHGPDMTRERVGRVLAHPGTSVIVARVDGQIVGSATLLRLLTLVGHFGYVEEVVVDESARGQGVGTALLGALIDLARHDGLDFLELTSRPTREAANALYRSVGFERRQTNVYRLRL